MKNTTFSLHSLCGLFVASTLAFSSLTLAHNHSGEEHSVPSEVTAELTIRNFLELPDNTLAGGQPDVMDLKILSAQGVKTVVNFRGAGEFEEFDEATEVSTNNMTYVHIPIDSKDALNKDNVEKFRAALDASNGGTFLHCGSGNRVGALFALDAYWNQNKSAKEALAIGKEAGLTSLTAHVESLLEE